MGTVYYDCAKGEYPIYCGRHTHKCGIFNAMKETWWKPALIFFAKVTAWITAPLLVALGASRYLGFSDQPLALAGAMLGAFGISVYGILRSAKSVKNLL